jgi:hypothetical protein
MSAELKPEEPAQQRFPVIFLAFEQNCSLETSLRVLLCHNPAFLVVV